MWSLCSWYSALVIHIFLIFGRDAKMEPPSQHMVDLEAGAKTLDLTSLGRVLFNYFMYLSGNPSNMVFPPASTI